jgi:hypothetical protein
MTLMTLMKKEVMTEGMMTTTTAAVAIMTSSHLTQGGDFVGTIGMCDYHYV